jgi:glyoxylase-like metal-dependent hydrolase (beta-lactamase superfamily II)
MSAPQLRIGDATVHLLNDGFWWDDGGAMFGVVPKDLWAREKPADERNRVHMSLVCPLIVADGEVILVDTGIGNRLQERERAIYRPERGAGLVGELRRLGLEPGDVTMVVLSHLHFDHCGGIVERGSNGTLAVTFPRARHLMQRREWEEALRPANPRQAAAYQHAAECLGPLTGRALELLDGPTSLCPSVRTVITGGHTATHQCVVVESAGEGLVHLADLAPMTPHLRAGWTAAYDLDPLAAIEAKTRLLADVKAKGWWVSFDHDDRVASGRLGGEERRPLISDAIATPTPPPR